MKLKDRKTGEVAKIHDMEVGDEHIYLRIVRDGKLSLLTYNSLAELNERWEDVPEEPKEYWWIDCDGEIQRDNYDGCAFDKACKQIGNYFETEEEAEKAVEKLKAWKRLKDKGFRFDGWEDLQAKMDIDGLMLFNRDVIDTDNVIGFRMDDYRDCIKDLNTCFGGEE